MRVDLGGGRGLWLEEAPAKSLARLQRDLGRQWQITEAGRYEWQQQAHWDRYVAYLNGGPWAPIAARPKTSVHEFGAAIDTNDRFVWLLNDHGWYQTVYRNGVLVEPWHFEYFPARDNHRHEVVTLVNIGGVWTLPPVGSTAGIGETPFEEDIMASLPEVEAMLDKKLAPVVDRLAAMTAQLELASSTTNFYKHTNHQLWIWVLENGDFVRIKDHPTAVLYKERNGGRRAKVLSKEAIQLLVRDLTEADGRDLSAKPGTVDETVETTAEEAAADDALDA